MVDSDISKIPTDKEFKSVNAIKETNRIKKRKEIRKKPREIVLNINLLNFILANICKNNKK